MSRAALPTPVAKRFGHALKRAQYALRLSMDDALQPIGLTTPQYAVMCALEAEPGMSNARLARACFVTAQTMQGVLSNLERTGIVVREVDPGNARVLRGSLSERGVAAIEQAHRLVAVVEARMAAAVGDEFATVIEGALYRCAEDLEANRR